MKTPFDLLAKMMPKPTPEDEADARKLGLSVGKYRAMKLQMQFEQAKKQSDESGEAGPPGDIAAEDAKAEQMRRDAGIIKSWNTAPNIFVQAAKTPGEVAKFILFVVCYVIGLAAFVIIGGERVQKMPGIFQAIILGLMIIPVKIITDRIWEAIGEGARDFFRVLVRFWPFTFVGLVFALGVLKALKQQMLP